MLILIRKLQTINCLAGPLASAHSNTENLMINSLSSSNKPWQEAALSGDYGGYDDGDGDVEIDGDGGYGYEDINANFKASDNQDESTGNAIGSSRGRDFGDDEGDSLGVDSA